jgi:hypothetical protein
VIAKKMKQRTDTAQPDMSEVIVNEKDVNVTLAHHAAWTDERFEGVEERLGGLELGQKSLLEAIGGLTVRVGSLEVAHVARHAEMGRMEARLSGKIDGLTLRIDKVLSFAVKDEPKLAAILKEQDDKS